MLRYGLAMSTVALVLVASWASAQQAGQGRGVFGGGFGGAGGMQISSAILLIIPEVQKELGFTEQQKKELDELQTEAREKLRSSFGSFNFQDFQNLSQEEREKRMADMRTKLEDAGKLADDKVRKILDAKQLKRLAELRLQREGPSAFSRAEVIKRLKLTDEQVAKIKTIQKDASPSLRFDRNQSEDQRRAAMDRVQEQRKKAQTDIQALLTDEQMIEWGEMWGKDFKFPPMNFRNFGGGQRTPARKTE